MMMIQMRERGMFLTLQDNILWAFFVCFFHLPSIELDLGYSLSSLSLNHRQIMIWLQLSQLHFLSNPLRISFHFSIFQSLTLLDVSKNDLKTAKLGTRLQLPSLVTLILSSNSISTIKKDDFSFLRNSSSLRVLHLSDLITQAKVRKNLWKWK